MDGWWETMKINQLSIDKITVIVAAGAAVTSLVILIGLYLLTNNLLVVYSGLLLTAAFALWGAVLLKLLQKKLSAFTSDLCKTLDGMMNGKEQPTINLEEETLLARISHRLERLYEIMQENRSKIAKEKAELQSLVSDISHQTKTPISNLKIINDTLMTKPMSEEKRQEFLQAAGGQLHKLDFLIQSMVKTSRLETGVITLVKKPLPISETLVIALNGILAPIEKKNIDLTVDYPEDLTLPHDSRWTAEAIFNLLDNAVKYTPVGSSIHVTVEEREMYVKIDVTDTGRGISEGEQATIFKRFYRSESVHEIEGIGIGLYLAREIITMQGGYIKVTSEVEKGSTFSVFLPNG
jgi:signal transduction histidine kinase